MIICVDFDIICHNFYTARNLRDLFHASHPIFCYTHQWPY